MIALHRPLALLVGLSFLTQVGAARPNEPSTEELETLWNTLAGADAAKAYRTIWAMAGAPKQTVPFLKQRLRPAPTVDARPIAQFVADLDHNRFAVRKKATDELENLRDVAEPALHEALAKNPSPEARQRIQWLLNKLEQPVTAPQVLQTMRAVEVLEKIGTPEARQVLAALARGAPQAWTTQDAKNALARLEKQPPGTPGGRAPKGSE